jgi:hypothetical protein
MMTRRIRRLSVAGISVLAAAGLATGATAAFADSGAESPEVRFVLNEDRPAGSENAGSHEDCPEKDGSGAASDAPEASDASSRL